MMALLSLVAHAALTSSAPAWVLDGLLSLPVAAPTAAWAVAVNDELRIWINRPEAGETVQLRVLKTRRVEQLSPLPIVAAGVACCNSELLVTGADASGRPQIVGVAANGRITWQHTVPGSTPLRWPVPGCAPQPVVVWQTLPGRLELARVGADGLAPSRSIGVGGPPLDIAHAAGAIWVAWAEAAAIHGKEITTQGVRDLHLATPYPSSVAIGACPDGACLAWLHNGSGVFSRVVPGMAAADTAVTLDLAAAAGGTLAVVSGPEPLIWAQRAETIEGEALRWTSALVLPGEAPLIVEGLVHAVTWWGEAVGIVGTGELLVLKRLSRPQH